jgi:S-formylglutathione hydrolase
MPLETISASRCFDGTQLVCAHDSATTNCRMRFAVFVPPQAESDSAPVVWFLSGLTCTEQNFATKAGAQRIAAELGLILVVPDTSPRGPDVPHGPTDSYALGQGAGFYLDALRKRWSTHYRMRSYLETELPQLIASNFPADMNRQAIMGHSMGGHGALLLALRSPHRFMSVSAFTPITSLMNCAWGEKALSEYLGPDRNTWRDYDCCELIEQGARPPPLLIDQGTADPFLQSQLTPDRLKQTCAAVGVQLTLRYQHGYDHSYFFIASFVEEHLRWHAQRLAWTAERSSAQSQ